MRTGELAARLECSREWARQALNKLHEYGLAEHAGRVWLRSGADLDKVARVQGVYERQQERQEELRAQNDQDREEWRERLANGPRKPVLQPQQANNGERAHWNALDRDAKQRAIDAYIDKAQGRFCGAILSGRHAPWATCERCEDVTPAVQGHYDYEEAYYGGVA
jgi:hypothetical protein